MFASPQVNLYCTELARAVGFYERLGFRETFRAHRSAGVPIHVELELGGMTLGLADVESARADHGLDVHADGRGAEVCVWTDQVDLAYDELVAAGAAGLSPPHDWLDGALRVAWVADPDGHPVELVQRRSVS